MGIDHFLQVKTRPTLIRVHQNTTVDQAYISQEIIDESFQRYRLKARHLFSNIIHGNPKTFDIQTVPRPEEHVDTVIFLTSELVPRIRHCDYTRSSSKEPTERKSPVS